MKTISLGLAALLSIIVAQNVLAQKVVITGEPAVITRSGDYYTLPSETTYTPKSDYYYVSMEGTRRVCYRETQPSLAAISPTDMSLRIGGETVSVHCYDYSPEYFTVTP